MGFKDRKSMALVNKTFYNASLHPSYLKHEVFVYNHDSVPPIQFEKRRCTLSYNQRIENTGDLNGFVKMIRKTKRKVINLKFNNVQDLHGVLPRFRRKGGDVKCLYLENTKFLSDLFLVNITKYCSNLEMLGLSYINVYSSTGLPVKPLPTFKSIHMTLNDMPELSFSALLKCAPYLDTIVLKQNMFMTVYDSTVVNINIMNYFQSAKHMTSLSLNGEPQVFLDLPDHIKLLYLKLECFKLKYYNPVEYASSYQQLKISLTKQTSLEELIISNVPCCLLSTITSLTGLKRLKVNFKSGFNRDCDNYKTCFKKFSNSLNCMKNLEMLTIHARDLSTTFVKPQIPEGVLRTLTSLNFYIEPSTNVKHFNTNLTTLRIKNAEILKSTDFKLIFKQLTRLTCLKMENCYDLNDDVLSCTPISNLKGK